MAVEMEEFLRAHYLFSALEKAEFEQLCVGVQVVNLEEDEHLFHFGQEARYFYLLDSGQIMLYRLSPLGDEKVIELIHAGQTFAEAVMFFEASLYPVSAKGILKSRLYQIDMAIFQHILKTSTPLCFRLLGGMSKRLHMAIQDIDQLTLQNANMRVIELLLQSAPSPLANHYQLEWDTPKNIIASRLSLRPETFSRVLAQLSKKGLISVQGKIVEIRDAKGLREEMGIR
jgi:CRP-like cAMP-binding protein